MRLIPAHAGKTSGWFSLRPVRRAHPRSRGENNNRPVIGLMTMGSSPLTRGKRGVLVAGRAAPRLIPAHAGKTAATMEYSSASTAHPRSRGEDCDAADFETVAQGSSPLTRGKRKVQAGENVILGLIPAHAGKTTRAA